MPFGLHKLKDTVRAGLRFSWQEEAWNWSCRESWATEGLATEGLATSAQLISAAEQSKGKGTQARGSSAAYTGLPGAGHGEELSFLWTEGLHAQGSLRLILIARCGLLRFLLVVVFQYLFTEILEGPSGHLAAQGAPRCPAQNLL